MIKKVTHIIPTMEIGGAQRLIVDLINASKDCGRTHEIIVFYDKLDLISEIKVPFKLQIVKKDSKLGLIYFAKLKKALLESGPDLVHTHLFGADLWGRVAARQLNLPVVTTEHNINLSEGWFKEKIRSYLRNHSDQYIAVSRQVKEYLQNKHEIKKPITVIRNGVDLNRFSGIEKPVFANPVKLLIVGRLVKQKGHEVVLKSLSRCLDLSWELTIAGSGEEELILKRLVNDLKLKAEVNFMSATHEVEQLYARHDIVLMPSLWEGQGIVAMEALASGRLLIASDLSSIREMINGGCAKFVHGDIAGWSNEIRLCLADTDNNKKIAQAGREWAMNNFSIQATVRKYLEIYDRIINR